MPMPMPMPMPIQLPAAPETAPLAPPVQRTEAPPPPQAPAQVEPAQDLQTVQPTRDIQDIQSAQDLQTVSETPVSEVHHPSPDSGPDPDPGPVAPLLGERPLTLRTVESSPPAAPVQRTAADPSAPATSPLPVAEPTAVPVRWVTADGGPAAVQRTARHTAPQAGPRPAHVQRSTAPQTAPSRTPAPGPLPSASPLPAPPPAYPPTPLPAPLPVSRLAVPGRAPVFDAGAVAVAAGVAQRMADGSVVFTQPGAAPGPVSAPTPTLPSYTDVPLVHRLPVQRETATEEPPPPPPEPAPPPAPAPEEPAPAAAATAETTASTAAPAGGPGHGSPAHQQTPPVTDEFVRALYPPLARLLKADLRLERERAGFLIEKR
ncbi:hypothetical protein [Streptomyces sp. NPDC004788]